MKNFTLDIVTYEYTGNYAADLVGYCTGHYCEGNAGKVQADIFNSEESYVFNNVERRIINNSLSRPFYSKGYQIKIFFKSKPTKEEVDIIKRRCQKFLNLKHEWIHIFITTQLKYNTLCDEYSNCVLSKEQIY